MIKGQKCICGGTFRNLDSRFLYCTECYIIIDPDAPTGELRKILNEEFKRRYPNFGYTYGRPWEDFG